MNVTQEYEELVNFLLEMKKSNNSVSKGVIHNSISITRHDLNYLIEQMLMHNLLEIKPSEKYHTETYQLTKEHKNQFPEFYL